MPELTPKNKLDSATLEKQEKEMFDTITARITSERYSDGLQTLVVETVINGVLETYPETPEGSLNQEEIDHITTALENPSQLQGSCSIFVDDDRVFHVQDGQVIQDELNYIPYLQEQKRIRERHAFREAEGQKLIPHVKTMLKSLGSNDSLFYESDNYIFYQTGERLKVINKNNSKEVLNHEGLTSIASDTDIVNLQKLQQIVERLKTDNPIIRSSKLKI